MLQRAGRARGVAARAPYGAVRTGGPAQGAPWRAGPDAPRVSPHASLLAQSASILWARAAVMRFMIARIHERIALLADMTTRVRAKTSFITFMNALLALRLAIHPLAMARLPQRELVMRVRAPFLGESLRHRALMATLVALCAAGSGVRDDRQFGELRRNRRPSASTAPLCRRPTGHARDRRVRIDRLDLPVGRLRSIACFFSSASSASGFRSANRPAAARAPRSTSRASNRGTRRATGSPHRARRARRPPANDSSGLFARRCRTSSASSRR